MNYRVITRTTVEQREEAAFHVVSATPVEIGSTFYVKEQQWLVGDVRTGRETPELLCVPWYFDLVRPVELSELD